MKIYCLAPNEDWVCDRFSYEWNFLNKDIITYDVNDADIIWLLADWCWDRIPTEILRQKKVVCTVHHIVPDKFIESKKNRFFDRDAFVDLYHVPSIKTHNQVSDLVSKKIYNIPFWVNQTIWFPCTNKSELRKKYNIDKDAYVVGSFQRDTEGNDLITPKLEKGPDIFIKYVNNLRSNRPDIHVLLAGWRRQYVIKELDRLQIPYTYVELPDFQSLNELYSCLDLYVVGSRYEGGPQSIFECAATKTPIVSTDVGAAREILCNNSLFDLESMKEAVPNVEIAHQNVQKFLLPHGMKKFREMFESL
jgi:glycosyltransferase involved in cell wall biosynthesis